MRVRIELEAPDVLSVLSEDELRDICSACAQAENELRSFSISVWSAKINKEHERHDRDRGMFSTAAHPKNNRKHKVEEDEDDGYVSMDEFFEE